MRVISFLIPTKPRPRRYLGHTHGEWLAGMAGAVLLLAIVAYFVSPMGAPL